MSTTLFRRATLLAGGDWTARAGVDVLVRDGVIAAIGPDLPAPDDAETIAADGLLLTPAFDNAHTHSPEALARGRAPMARLDEWLSVAYQGGIDALGERGIHAAIASAAADCIRGGAVSVTDHFRQVPPRVESVRAAAAAWAASGLRARIAVLMRDGAMPDGTALPDARALLDLMRACLAESMSGVALGIGPSAPQRCSDDLLRGAAELARQAGSFVHLHVCETATDKANCLALYGISAIAHLDGIGVLGPATELAHCVHIDDDDLRRLAATGTTMVHNPVANMRLGSGVAPMARALELGVRVRLGSDGAGSNDTQSMLEATKLACFLPRASGADRSWLSPEQSLDIATGGQVLRHGAVADLLAFDLTAPGFSALSPASLLDEIAARVVMAARDHDIVHVMAGGEFLMRDRGVAVRAP